MAESPSQPDDPARIELEARADSGNPEAIEGLKVLAAATDLVETTSSAIREAMAIAAAAPAVRPTAAEVAKRRPQSAAPKPADTPAPKATLTASGAPVAREEALAAIGRSVGGSLQGGLSGDGRQYVFEIPLEGRKSLGQDAGENAAVVASVFAETQKARADGVALTAALGCAPAEPHWGLFPSISSATAGVLELPELLAPRGSVYISPTPTVYSLSDDVGIGDLWDGASSKVCYTDTCVDANEYDTEAHFTCITTSNATQLFYPERYDALISEAMRAHAQNVNAWLISELESASVQFGDPGSGGGATVSVFRAVALAAGWYRARYKADLSLRLEAVFPSWVADVLEADAIARDSTIDYGVGLSRWITNLRRLNVNPQFVYGYQESPSAPTPPLSTDWLLFASGAVHRLRGRTIDLGVVRDSTLNAANNVGFFAETWDGLGYSSGLDVIEIQDTATCATGATGDRTSITCEVGS